VITLSDKDQPTSVADFLSNFMSDFMSVANDNGGIFKHLLPILMNRVVCILIS
jgi:hypothetical protein